MSTDPRSFPYHLKIKRRSLKRAPCSGGTSPISCPNTSYSRSCLLISPWGDWTPYSSDELQNNLCNCIEIGCGLQSEAQSHFSKGGIQGSSGCSLLFSTLRLSSSWKTLWFCSCSCNSAPPSPFQGIHGIYNNPGFLFQTWICSLLKVFQHS